MGQIKRNDVYKMPGAGSETVSLVLTIFPGTSIWGFKKKVIRAYEKDMKLRIYTLKF